MFFDFFNTLAIFPRYINQIYIKKLNIFIIMYLNSILIYTKDLGQPHVKAVY